MKITLKRKASDDDKDPLIVQYLEGRDGKQVKKTMAVRIGETIDVDDDLAYELLHKYKGLFALEGPDAARVSSKTQQFAHRGKPPYENKAGAAGEG